MSGSLRVPVLLVWFAVLWVALWGQITLANVLSGVAVSIAVVLLARLPDTDIRSYGVARFRPLRSLWFLVYFVAKLFQANVMLAWEVLTPRNTINPGIIGVRLRDCSDALVTLIANAFTLTPGSLTIEVTRDPTVIYVHVLHLNDPDRVRSDLVHLARLAVQAFGPAEALVQFDEGIDAMLPPGVDASTDGGVR